MNLGLLNVIDNSVTYQLLFKHKGAKVEKFLTVFLEVIEENDYIEYSKPKKSSLLTVDPRIPSLQDKNNQMYAKIIYLFIPFDYF